MTKNTKDFFKKNNQIALKPKKYVQIKGNNF